MAGKRKKEHHFDSMLIDEPIQRQRTDKFIDPSKLKIDFKCKNKTQKDFVNLIENNQIVLSNGLAGVGKSYLSIAKSLQFLKEERYKKICIITPAIESEEKLGFLPGDLLEKLQPYLYSTYYLIDKLIGKPNRLLLMQNDYIEPISLGFLRGVNIDDAVLIFEEAQNCTKRSMKTLLTRIGFNSKFIISGDLDQIDNDKIRKKSESGLYHAIKALSNKPDVGVIEFTKDDEIVRNPLIAMILKSFDEIV